MKTLFVISLIALITINSPAAPRAEPNVPSQEGLEAKCVQGLESAPKEVFLKYKAYLVSYNPIYKVPNYVSHENYKDALERKCAKRNDNFKADKRLQDDFHLNPVSEKDYKGSESGYDRGHMAPSGDFAWSQIVNNETFFMTNMSPQSADLNQKSWNALEDRIRRWTCGNGHLKIFTGPVLKPGLKRLASCVAVPEQFFKVVLSDKAGDYKAIGFIYGQEDSTDVWKERAMTIQEVQLKTGLNFFTEFPEDIARKFKSSIDLKAWEDSEADCHPTADLCASPAQ